MTSTDTPRIRTATAKESTAIGTLIATSFADLDVARWLVDDRAERIRALAGQFSILVEHACAYGTVYTVAGPDGQTIAAAVWLDYTQTVPEPAGYEEKLIAITGDHLDRFRALDEAFAAHHPERPHQHLAFLATLPRYRSRGIGTVLMDHHHARLDASGTAAYLEASSARTRDLYTRNGYRASDKTIVLPEGPTMWPMWRPAQA